MLKPKPTMGDCGVLSPAATPTSPLATPPPSAFNDPIRDFSVAVVPVGIEPCATVLEER